PIVYCLVNGASALARDAGSASRATIRLTLPCSSHVTSQLLDVLTSEDRVAVEAARSWSEDLHLGAQGIDLLFEPGVLDRAPDEGRGRRPIGARERAQAFELLGPDPGEEITLWDCS